MLELLASWDSHPVLEMPVLLSEIPSLPEAFIVSTTRNVVPVTCIDDVVIGSGKPGPVTCEVAHRVEEYLAGVLTIPNCQVRS